MVHLVEKYGPPSCTAAQLEHRNYALLLGVELVLGHLSCMEMGDTCPVVVCLMLENDRHCSPGFSDLLELSNNFIHVWSVIALRHQTSEGQFCSCTHHDLHLLIHFNLQLLIH